MQILEKMADVVDYSLDVTDNLKNFPKSRKFSFVNPIQKLSIDIYMMLNKVNESPVNKRKDMLIEVLGLISGLMLMIRLSERRGFISKRQLGYWSKMVTEVKYMTIGWLKKY